ncbi:sulfatase-like hydrolase/transferase, partial [Candidatus Bathyarchaeota archaeon]|nr:sulfatase-like hydrolase/transferase [Candidatus Bathyarchaeota archaeon]
MFFFFFKIALFQVMHLQCSHSMKERAYQAVEPSFFIQCRESYSMARRKPNILIFICDHLTRRVLGAYGNENTAAPAIDALAHDGVAVDNVYTPTPLCRPTRAAFWTGRYPHETGVLSNGGRCNDATVRKDVPTVGEIFKQAGYETIHFGKTHDHGGLRGFKNVVQFAEETKPEHPAWPVGNNTHCDRFTANCIIDFLEKRDDEGNPFIAVADFNNPHEICSWVGHNAGKHEDIPVPGDLPTLPSNFETPDLASRPLPIQYLCCSHRRMFQAAKWTRENYRHYLAAFRHYTSRVDREISRVMQTLSSMPGGDNT